MTERDWLERHLASEHGIEPGQNMPIMTLDRLHTQDHEHADEERESARLGYALLVASMSGGFIIGMITASFLG